MLMNLFSLSLRVRAQRVHLGLLALLLACGCTAKKDARVTSSETARQSLNAALTAWKNGQPAEEIKSVSPPVQIVDSVWAKGRKLESYEILNEETQADGVRCFSVRLNLENPKAGEEVRYVVKGQSPVWVYRQDDLKRSQSWQGYK